MQELFENLGLNLKLLIAQAVNFLLVFWLLKKFVFSKLLKIIDERKNRIQSGLDMRDKAEHELERIDEARRREFDKSRKEREAVLLKARDEAKEQEQEILAGAKGQEEKILAKAKIAAQKEKEDLLKKTETDLKEAAILLAERILQREVTDKDDDRLAKEVVNSLGKEYAR